MPPLKPGALELPLLPKSMLKQGRAAPTSQSRIWKLSHTPGISVPIPSFKQAAKVPCAPLSLMPLTTAIWQHKETLSRPKREEGRVTPKWLLGVSAVLGIRASGWFWLHGCNLVRGSEGQMDWEPGSRDRTVPSLLLRDMDYSLLGQRWGTREG